MLYSVQVIASSQFCRLKSVSSTSLLYGTNLGFVVFSWGGLYFFTRISSERNGRPTVYNRTYGRSKTQMSKFIRNSRSFLSWYCLHGMTYLIVLIDCVHTKKCRTLLLLTNSRAKFLSVVKPKNVFIDTPSCALKDDHCVKRILLIPLSPVPVCKS